MDSIDVPSVVAPPLVAAPSADGSVARPGSLLRRSGRIVQAAGPMRLVIVALMLIAATMIARQSWHINFLPFLGDAERAYFDLRQTAFAPHVMQDNRIVMVVYNDQTLIDTRKRSPLDRSVLAQALRNLDGMGAKSIGIDILIDQPQDEDPQLIAAFRAMRTPTFLAYANTESNQEQVVYEQQKFLEGFLGALKGSQVRPASIRLFTDNDGVARSWPLPEPGLPPLLGKAMAPGHARAFDNYAGSIRYLVPAEADRDVIPSFPIDLFRDPALAVAFADHIRGRHVLIGGDIVDADQFETPMTAQTGKTMIGLAVHANILAQMLDGAVQHPLPSTGLWALALLVVAAGMLTSLQDMRWWLLVPFMLAQVVLFGGLPFLLQSKGVDTQDLPAIGWAVGWVIAYAAAGSAARAVGSEQRRFAQSALGKYLPADIAREILEEPERLTLHGQKRDIFVVFTDLEGFTKLSHAIAPEMVASLLNRYLDMLSEVVLRHGGTIDKFVGDAVVAFWGAPISRPDDGRRAAEAANALYRAGETFRQTVPPGAPPIGRTRVGLHHGEAIVGNFGGEGRIQYTALGDTMNTASRLEAANKLLGSNVLASREAVESSGLGGWRPLGRIVLRGRATPVEIFDPAPDFPAGDVDHLTDLLHRLETGAGDRAEAVAELDALVARHPGDKALEILLFRMKRSETGEAYVLD